MYRPGGYAIRQGDRWFCADPSSVSLLGVSAGPELKPFETVTFGYAGHAQVVNLPPGRFRIECWGAGVPATCGAGGKGAYTKGILTLLEPRTLRVFVGEGTDMYRTDATWNGGGGCVRGSTESQSGTAGSGATDIRLAVAEGNADAWGDAVSLRSRIMVAGGGGGSVAASQGAGSGNGGFEGTAGVNNQGYNHGGQGGTQTAGGARGDRVYSGTWGTPGTFGIGGEGGGGEGPNSSGGGGGGYYGGGGGSGGSHATGAGGGGGSSFISGMNGCIAVNAAGIPTDQPTHFSGLVFTECVIQDGVHSGHGAVIITPV